MSLIDAGNEIEAQAAIDSFIADFNDRPQLPFAISQIEERYYIRILSAESWARENYLYPVELWEKAISRIPGFYHSEPDLHYFIGCCYYQLGKYEKAIERYNAVIDNWPDYNHLGKPRRMIEICFEKLTNAKN